MLNLIKDPSRGSCAIALCSIGRARVLARNITPDRHVRVTAPDKFLDAGRLQSLSDVILQRNSELLAIFRIVARLSPLRHSSCPSPF